MHTPRLDLSLDSRATALANDAVAVLCVHDAGQGGEHRPSVCRGGGARRTAGFDSLCPFIGLTRTIDLAAVDLAQPPDRATG